MLGAKLDVFLRFENVGEVELGQSRSDVATIAIVHERGESFGELVKALVGDGGPVVIGLGLLNQPSFLSDDVYGQREFADLSGAGLREGGILFLLPFELGEGGFENVFFKAHGFEIGLRNDTEKRLNDVVKK